MTSILTDPPAPTEAPMRMVSHVAVALKALEYVPGWKEYNAAQEVTSVGGVPVRLVRGRVGS